MKSITIRTSKMWTDLTPYCIDYIKYKGSGFLHIMSQHTTAGILIFEKELLLLADVNKFFSNLIPLNNDYNHDLILLREVPATERINAAAHLRSLFIKTSELIPFQDNKLCLGQWQTPFLVELDGERDRTILLSIFKSE